MSKMNIGGKGITKRRQIFPIYDWRDDDVWLYLKQQEVKIPNIYLYLWQSGHSRRQLRVSQFFSIDTARSLVKMNEYYPNLMERIIMREPNAYLAALYWDSEMFGRSSRKRKELERSERKDYKALLIHMFGNFDKYFDTPHKRKIAKSYKNFFLSVSAIVGQEDCKQIYEGLISGDPKSRTLRALYQRVYSRYINEAKKARREGKNNA
jgi:predicted phosphoadenosine phosphosulfate sulfurtransferase